MDDRHIVGHGCMRIDSLWNLRHRVEVGEWGWRSSLIIELVVRGSLFYYLYGCMHGIVEVQRKIEVQVKEFERRVCVCRLRCTAGQLLAVFLASCRSAFLMYPLGTKHDRTHAVPHAR